jgi:UDP-N-acetylmuramyl pentapeptide synthase
VNRTKNWQALGRLKTGVMNRVESAYAEYLKTRSDVCWSKFEGLKFRLADNTFYTPDFTVMLKSGALEAHEVKGFWQDDARAKIKIAADMYPIKFIAVKVRAKKRGGGWEVEEF